MYRLVILFRKEKLILLIQKLKINNREKNVKSILVSKFKIKINTKEEKKRRQSNQDKQNISI